MPPNRGGRNPGNHGCWGSSCRQAGRDSDDDDDDGDDGDDDDDDDDDDDALMLTICQSLVHVSKSQNVSPLGRGVRYIDEKLSKADKSVFLKLSATYRYRKVEI